MSLYLYSYYIYLRSIVVLFSFPTRRSSYLQKLVANLMLHSFPTRRSSDLRKLVANLMEAVRAVRDDRLHVIAVERLDRILRQHLIQILAKNAIETLRSEEHTSELQSRQYLVCRLLLEKKKKKQTNTTKRKS